MTLTTLLAGGLLFVQAPQVEAIATSATGTGPTTCILHVYGAMTPPRTKPRQVSLVLQYEGFMRDSLNPASIAYEYDPVVRSKYLTDDELRGLFSSTEQIKIIRHGELLNIEEAQRVRLVSPSSNESSCNAELILFDISAIFAPSQSVGMLPDALIGGNRMTASFLFRRTDAQNDHYAVVTKKVSGRLPPLQKLQSNFALYRTSLQSATSVAFAEFLDAVMRTRP